MTFKEAIKQCKKVGCAHATGDALAAMYANLVAQMHGGKADLYYKFICSKSNDSDITEASRTLLRDRAKAWDVLMQINP